VQRIRSYAGSPPAFATVGELEAYFRTVYKPYGWLSDAQWRRLTETSVRRLPDGRVTPHYDPAMVQQFIAPPARLRPVGRLGPPRPAGAGACAASTPTCCCPRSEAMRARGPRAVVVTIPGCGHAPALNTPEQFALVERFLLAA
jgi:pimeloyl-ACP methyl ester carboxylesterase